MINIEKYLIRFSMYDSVLAKKRTGKKTLETSAPEKAHEEKKTH